MKRLYVVGLGPGGQITSPPRPEERWRTVKFCAATPLIWTWREILPREKSWSPPP